MEKAQLTTSPWRTLTRNAPAFNTTLVLHQWVPLSAQTHGSGVGAVPWPESPTRGSGLIHSLSRHWEASPKSCPRAPLRKFPLTSISGGTESWRKCSAILPWGSGDFEVPDVAPFLLLSTDVPHSSPGHSLANYHLGAKSGPPPVFLQVLLEQPCHSCTFCSCLLLPYNGRIESQQ